MKRPNYGIDAPTVVLRFLALGIIALGAGIACIRLQKTPALHWTGFLAMPAISFGAFYFLTAAVMLWGSRIGKLRLRDKVVESIPWRGDELVLDVGCGHGLMLIAAAKYLTHGKAIGIDLWQKEDQAGNSREAAWKNVQLENVADRVELRDGDARTLDFPDNTFDVVLSSWAIHNIYDAAGRAAAVRQIVRVLKPGGRVVIVDIRCAREYSQMLKENRMQDVTVSRPNFLFFIPTHTVSAIKPF